MTRREPEVPGNDVSIERQADLEIGIDALWALISTAEGWRSWLVDDAAIAVSPNERGTAIDGGVARAVRIDAVIEGRSVTFSWWNRGDESSRSVVQLDIVELAEGRSRLHVSERLVGASGTAAVTATAWEVRLVSLWVLLAQQSLTMA